MSAAKQHAPAPRTQSAAAQGESEELSSEADRGNSFAQTALGAPAPQGAAGGMFGWFKKAGNWVADNYNKAADAVGGFVDRTGKAARDLYEVWSSSDLSYQDGTIGLDTDMDEVMDLLPESARQALQLDRSAGSENKVKVEFDTRAKALTVRAPDLRIAGVNHAKVRSGAASLKGVVITITNPNGGLPGLDGAFSMLGYQDKDDNVGVDISVGSVVARDLELPDGSMRAGELELGGFRANASARGGLPFGEKGATVASFSVGNAVVRGLSAPGTEAEEVGGTELAGGLDQSAETAYLEAGQLQARGLTSGGRSLGSGSLRDLRADIRNQGGGMPLLDQRADHMVSTVSAGEARVLDARDAGLGRLGSGHIQGLRATHDADRGSAQLSAQALSATGVDTDATDIAAIDASNVNADVSIQDKNVSAGLRTDRAQVRGLDSAALDASAVEAGGLSARFQRDGDATGFRLLSDSLDAEGLDAGGTRAGRLSTRGLSAELDQRGANRSGRASVGGLALSGLDSAAVDATGLNASALRGSFTSAGDALKADASLGSATVTGLDTAQADARTLSVGNLNASLNKDGRALSGQASADSLAVAGLDTAQADAASLDARALRGSFTSAGDALKADSSLGSATVTGLDTAQADARTLSVGNLNASLNKDGRALSGQASADSLAVAGLDTAQADAANLDARVLRGSFTSAGDALKADASLGSATVTGLDTAQADARTLSVGNLAASLDRDGKRSSASASADSLAVAGLDTAAVDAASLRATRLRASQQDGALSASAGQIGATGLKAEGVEVREAALEEASVRASGDRLSATLGSGQLRDATLDTATVDGRLASASVRGLSHEQRGQQSETRAAGLRAEDLRFQIDPSTGKSAGGAPSGFDAAQLTRTLSARVDDADLRASVPMRAGQYESGVGIGVEDNTRLDASLRVRDNRIEREGTSARFSNPLDGPVWTTLNGAYVDKDGRLKADVGGWGDQDLSASINKGLGVPGKGLASVATYGDAAADKMEAPAPGRTRDGKPGLGDALALDQANLQARVGLSAGTVDAGNASVNLAGNNTVDVQSRGGDALVVSFAQFLTQSLNLNAGGQSVQTGAGALGGTSLTLDQGGADKGTVRGSIGSVAVEDLRHRR